MEQGLTKLKIEAFKGPKFRDKDKISGLEFTAMFNPTTFNRKLEIEYQDGQGFGTSSSSKKFKKIKPQDYNIELLVDGTGASGIEKNVSDEVAQFLKVCAEYNGEAHRPNYVMISWAKLILKAVLTTVDVSYTLFDREGVPLRARIGATFSGTVDDDLRTKEEKNSSPDLTHSRVIKEGDTLPLMAERIYGNSKYYLQVAKANGLKNFRNLKPGEKLFFPPIDK